MYNVTPTSRAPRRGLLGQAPVHERLGIFCQAIFFDQPAPAGSCAISKVSRIWWDERSLSTCNFRRFHAPACGPAVIGVSGRRDLRQRHHVLYNGGGFTTVWALQHDLMVSRIEDVQDKRYVGGGFSLSRQKLAFVYLRRDQKHPPVDGLGDAQTTAQQFESMKSGSMPGFQSDMQARRPADGLRERERTRHHLKIGAKIYIPCRKEPVRV